MLTVFAQAERIDNFVLLDQHGDAHNLYYHKDKSAIVVMIQGNGCPIVRNALTDYKALRDQYAGQGVHFLMLNSNLQDQRSTIFAEAEKYGIDMPILHDESQLVGESLNLIRTAEVLVIDPKTWNIVNGAPSTTDRFTSARKPKRPIILPRTPLRTLAVKPLTSPVGTRWAA